MPRVQPLVPLFMFVACCPSGPTLLDVLDGFENEESGLDFFDCGGDYALKDCKPRPGEGSISPQFEATSQCILEKWKLCEPAKAKLHWTNLPSGHEHADRYLYVIPGDKCQLITFESTRSDQVSRLTCDQLLENGECGVVEADSCDLESITNIANPTCH